jgi:hypothetical protein
MEKCLKYVKIVVQTCLAYSNRTQNRRFSYLNVEIYFTGKNDRGFLFASFF